MSLLLATTVFSSHTEKPETGAEIEAQTSCDFLVKSGGGLNASVLIPIL